MMYFRITLNLLWIVRKLLCSSVSFLSKKVEQVDPQWQSRGLRNTFKFLPADLALAPYVFHSMKEKTTYIAVAYYVKQKRATKYIFSRAKRVYYSLVFVQLLLK